MWDIKKHTKAITNDKGNRIWKLPHRTELIMVGGLGGCGLAVGQRGHPGKG